jgi:chloramphenicol-sensitive protein RarD
MNERQVAGKRQARLGLSYGLASYVWWALMPVYFKLVAHVAPMVVLAHRVVWSFLLLAVFITVMSQWREARATLANRRTLLLLSASTFLIAINWGTFIYAVGSGRVMQASLGYFIMPLVSVALGVSVLRERMRRWQLIGLLFAIAGVAVLTIARRQLPWIAIAIALSWSGYSLVRKVTHVGPLIGVAIETAIMVPFAAAYILFTLHRHDVAPLDMHSYAVLSLSGVITAVPLLWFTAAARRLRLITLGLLQYVTPTGQFLLAVLAYHERFDASNILGFALIWMALMIYSLDLVFDSDTGFL